MPVRTTFSVTVSSLHGSKRLPDIAKGEAKGGGLRDAARRGAMIRKWMEDWIELGQEDKETIPKRMSEGRMGV